ncbi:MAG: hypothetical protein ACI8Y7_000307 [Candidatus Woesearchaeota archaeon]|jgi:hypothetical protein
MKKFHISASIFDPQAAQEYYSQVEQHGHCIPYKWVGKIGTKPFAKDPKKVLVSHLKKEIQNVRECDVFVLISDYSIQMRGAHAEFGIAIERFLSTGSPKIFVYAKDKKWSAFTHLSYVTNITSFTDIFADI